MNKNEDGAEFIEVISSSSEYSSVNSTHNNNIDIHNNETIHIENIQGEENLIEYTKNHVTNKFYEDLRRIQCSNSVNNNYSVDDNYLQSNSPISFSNPGSKENSLNGSSSNNSDNEYENRNIKKSFYNYYHIEKTIDKCYDNIEDNNYSTEIDILTTYAKGQKHLYTQSKNYFQWKLNLLMFPALFLTAAITIIAPFIECQHWSVGTISGINAVIAFLISLINYLKYESSIESFLLMANQFDKLEISLDLTNSKLLMMDSDIDKRKLVLHKIKEFEKKMNELKEFNKTLIPEEIKMLFPIISHIQIFSFIKKIENYKKTLLIKYKEVNGEIKYILNKWKLDDFILEKTNTHDNIKENNRVTFLYQVREKIKVEIYKYKNTYTNIDNLFSKEITNAESKRSHWFKKKTVDLHKSIDNYLDINDSVVD
jgi:hypothetical protein